MTAQKRFGARDAALGLSGGGKPRRICQRCVSMWRPLRSRRRRRPREGAKHEAMSRSDLQVRAAVSIVRGLRYARAFRLMALIGAAARRRGRTGLRSKERSHSHVSPREPADCSRRMAWASGDRAILLMNRHDVRATRILTTAVGQSPTEHSRCGP